MYIARKIAEKEKEEKIVSSAKTKNGKDPSRNFLFTF